MLSFIEVFLLEFGFSWFWSKLLPYVLLPLLGLGIGLFLMRYIRHKSVLFKSVFLLVFPCTMFLLYFALSPIYQGDFDNQKESTPLEAIGVNIPPKQLTVVSIPGCPFCYEAMDKLLLLKKRNPQLRIVYDVITQSEEDLQWYRKKGGKKIIVQKATNIEALAKLAGTGFPTFLINNGRGDLYSWSNRHFGCGALDEIESIVRQ